MHCPAATEPARTARRSRTLLLIPATAFLLGVAAAIAAARTRPEPYHGVYRQEVVEVVATASGRVVSVDRPHGEAVKPGEPLVTIEDAAIGERVASLTSERESLRRRLDEASGKASVEVALRTDALEKERLETRLRYADLLRARLDVQVRRKALEEGRADGASIAADPEGFVRPVSAESRAVLRRLELSGTANHEEVLGTQISLCEQRLAEIESLKDSLGEQMERSFGVDRLRADLEAVDAKLAEAEAAEATVAIASPAYGRVGIHRRRPGEFAAAGETLVEVFDSERPYVLLTVPLSELATLTPGRRVRVEFEGIETRKPLEGTVAEVASEAERDADAATAPGSVLARVKITPTGRLWPTPPPGATALVHIDE